MVSVHEKPRRPATGSRLDRLLCGLSGALWYVGYKFVYGTQAVTDGVSMGLLPTPWLYESATQNHRSLAFSETSTGVHVAYQLLGATSANLRVGASGCSRVRY
jgi:hypothetical protein